MKTRCERPYQSMIATAGAVRRLPEEATDWHVRRLATELAHAVVDLDAGMRAGLVPPRPWQPVELTQGQPQDTDEPDDSTADDGESGDHAPPSSPVFYRLPATDIEEGMSTDDGQDIVSVSGSNEWIFADVYTPRSDDPEQDAHNRDETECRAYRRDQLVGMATFADTAIDGSNTENAQPHPQSARHTA